MIGLKPLAYILLTTDITTSDFCDRAITSTPRETPMLNPKALTLAVVIGVLSPILPPNVLSESPVLAQTQQQHQAEANRVISMKPPLSGLLKCSSQAIC
ncbi:hypothetical protein ACL6C3_16425 [Capilliphycus salinus ALCB114379]|uniref:hypothetical protein n=1 Tax=Capilliphycus salinus TaxID=2768948 RepID=UPI0039A6942D